MSSKTGSALNESWRHEFVDRPTGTARGALYDSAESDSTERPASPWASLSCVVHRAGSFVVDADWVVTERVLAVYSMFVSHSGSWQFSVAGESYTLPSLGVAVVPPHVPHAAAVDRSVDQPVEVDVVHFSLRTSVLLDMQPPFTLPVICIPTKDRGDQIRRAVRRVVDELRADLPIAILAANSQCGMAVALISRHAAEQRSLSLDAHRLQNQERLTPAIQVIRSSFEVPLLVEDLARVVHLHPVYFARLFRATFGMPPSIYLRAVRLEKACELLAATEAGNATIARRCGFGTAAYLGRVFKETMAMTPQEYRSRHSATGAKRSLL